MAIPTTVGIDPFKPGVRYNGTLYIKLSVKEQAEDLALQPALVCCKDIHDATVAVLRQHGFVAVGS